MQRFTRRGCAVLIAALALASAALYAPTSNAASREPAAARLTIRRAANLGVGLFLTVSIDGVKVADLGYGQTYDAPVSSGQHVLSVILRPNQLFLRPTQTNLTVEPGRTYVLTAMWEGEQVVLR